MKYSIREESGATETIEAESMEDAIEEAKEWVSEGSYDRRVIVDYWVAELKLAEGKNC